MNIEYKTDLQLQYIDGLVTDFDLLIVGGYWNRTRTVLSKFVLAVHDKLNTGGPHFHACTNVWSGLTHQQFTAVNAQLRPHWNIIQKHDKTARLQFGPIVFGAAVPDVWFEPSRSVVLQVRAAELVPTRTFATRCSMRFPRVQAVRSDKPWHDCCTLREFEELCKVSECGPCLNWSPKIPPHICWLQSSLIKSKLVVVINTNRSITLAWPNRAQSHGCTHCPCRC